MTFSGELWDLMLLADAASGGTFGLMLTLLGAVVLAWAVWSYIGLVRDGRVDLGAAFRAMLRPRRRRRPSLEEMADPAPNPELDSAFEHVLREELTAEAERYPLTADVDEMVARWHEEDQRRSA